MVLLRPTHLCCILLALWGAPVSQALSSPQDAPPLLTRINKLLLSPSAVDTMGQIDLQLQLRTPPRQLQDLCANPTLRLLGHPVRITGNRSIIATCDRHHFFIQVYVNATATYWLARQALSPGQAIRQGEIESYRGELSGLPGDILLDPQRIIGAIPTRTLQPGTPMTAGALRRQWVIHASNEVDIEAPGSGFLIHAKGKALDNAGLNDTLRVQTHTGQIIQTTAIGEDKVAVNLQ